MKKSKKQRKKGQQSFDRGQEATYRSRAWKALDDGNPRRAREEIDAILKCNPQADVGRERVQLQILLGDRLFAQRDVPGALQAYQRARAASDDPNVAFTQVIRCHVELHEVGTALTLARESFANPSLDPSNAGMLLKLLLLTGERSEAADLANAHRGRFAKRDLDWFAGVQALYERNGAEARARFEESRRGVSERERRLHDSAAAWIAYADFSQGNAASALAEIDAITDPFLRSRMLLFHHQRTGDTRTFERARSDDPQGVARLGAGKKFARELLDVLDEEGVHEAAHYLESIRERTSGIPGIREVEASFFTHAALEAFRNGEFSCALGFWEEAIERRIDDLQFHLNVLLYSWPSWGESIPRWAARALQLLEREAAERPQEWPPKQVAFTRGEISALTALHFLANEKSLRARTEAEKAMRDAPTSGFTLLLKGRLTMIDGEPAEAVKLFEEALRNGLPLTLDIYDEVADAYVAAGAPERAAEFRRQHGRSFGIEPESALRTETRIYFALSKKDVRYIAAVAEKIEGEHYLLKAVRFFLDASPRDDWEKRGKITASVTVDETRALIESARNEREAAAYLQYLSLALPIYRKTPALKKVLLYLETELERRSSTSIDALMAKVNVAAVTKVPAARFDPMVRELLRRVDRPEATLVQLHWLAYVFGFDNRYFPYIKEALVREPEYPGLLWAMSTVSGLWVRIPDFRERGLAIARRLQDESALELFRIEDFLDELEGDFEDGLAFGFEVPGSSVIDMFGSFLQSQNASLASVLKELIACGGREPDDKLKVKFIMAVLADPDGAEEELRRLNAPPLLRSLAREIIESSTEVDSTNAAGTPKRGKR